jgi:cell division GTPase FtsZ
VKIAMVCGKFSAPTLEEIKDNIEAASKVAKKYISLGYFVICPHLYTGSFYGLQPEKFFREGYLELVCRIDTLIVMKNHIDSEGAKAEIELANRYGIEIMFD